MIYKCLSPHTHTDSDIYVYILWGHEWNEEYASLRCSVLRHRELRFGRVAGEPDG